jgi:hypothetical protein
MRLKTLMMMSLASVLLVGGCNRYCANEHICHTFQYIYHTDKDKIVSRELKEGIVYHNELLADTCNF